MSDYDQPFYVGRNNPRFPTARNGYLLALEPRQENEVHFVDTQWSNRQWDTINQLRGELNFLTSKVNEMRANASKRRPKTKY